MSEPAMVDSVDLGELAALTHVARRTIRYYTTRGLLPGPRRLGRYASYGAEHLARLLLIRDLQAHGLTLAAVDQYFAGIPDDASADEITLRRLTLQPFQPTQGSPESSIARDRSTADAYSAELVDSCNAVYRRHSQAMVEELEELFRANLWAAYQSSELDADQLVAVLQRFHRTALASLTQAFSDAMTSARRVRLGHQVGSPRDQL